ncbi:MAG: PfkB family carbohydrate kinase [Myxococcota bacterium]|nr:PfkB family carbohydrate kinase [Myxococcota bacterium]
MKIAVVGHLEWVDFVDVTRVPMAGEIVHGTPVVGVAAGGGAVAAVALARWGVESLFFTSFGGDDLGTRARAELEERGVTLHAMTRDIPQRRAVTLVDAQRERTIIVIGARHVAHGADPLPWHELAQCDAVYVTGGDAAAVRAARTARVVVATSRVLPLLRESGIQIDALVGSANDPDERFADGDLDPSPHLVVRTDGARGGTYTLAGTTHAYAAVPGVVQGDTYGAGDTFAAGLTYALGDGRDPAEAISFASGRAAEILSARGPYPSGAR